MTRNPDCVVPETKVADAVLLMIERGYRHLPIVTEAKKILACSRCARHAARGAGG